MNFLSQLFGGQPGVTTGVPRGTTAEQWFAQQGAQSPLAGPGGLAGPMGGNGLDIEGFAADQYGKPNRQANGGPGGFLGNFGQAMQQQGKGGPPTMPELPQIPQMHSAQGRLAEILASIGQRGNFLGRLGGTF